MIWLRAALVSVLSVLGLAEVSGCTHGDPKPNYSSVTGPPTVTTASSSAAGAPTRSAGSGAPTSVPVDQIPPGRPAKWVPAGVPTVAPYKEPGDVVPMFTLAMFKNNQLGALDAARYYLDARNWTIATLDPTAFLLICDSQRCKANGEVIRAYKRAHQHVVGARETADAPTVVRAPGTSGAGWVIQVKLHVQAGKIVDSGGKALQLQQVSSQLVNLYLKWETRMWRVQQDVLAQ